MLARYRALREDHLRYLVKCGVLRPVLRTNADTFFAFPDLAAIKQANEGLAQGAQLPQRRADADRGAAGPARVRLPDRCGAGEDHRAAASRPRDSRRATKSADRRRRGAARHRAGRGIFPARRPRSTKATTRRRKRRRSPTARRWSSIPYLVAALINLANIHYSRDELAEAQALYERAIGLESDFFEAHFNLGNIYHDLGRFPEAQACYREALRLNPYYADAHFYLAVTFEKMGQSQDARPHWRSYQQLAPQGEWVELAREFSE